MIFQFHKGETVDTYVDTNSIIAVQHKKSQPTPVITIYLDSGEKMEAHYAFDKEQAVGDFEALVNDLRYRTGNGDSTHV